jgi:hypothetical protein
MKRLISTPFSKNETDTTTASPDVNLFSPEESVPPTSEPTSDELGRLRDILFGTQTRTIEKRLSDLEVGLPSARREISDTFSDKLEALSSFTSAQLSDARNEFNQKLETLGADQGAQLRARQKELIERFDHQDAEQTVQLRAVQKELSEGLDKLAADFLHQLRAAQKELSDQIEKQGVEQTERMRNLQAEARQRDDSLRQELLALTDSLENKKTSRQDLGQMLVEMGIRLRRESDSSS